MIYDAHNEASYKFSLCIHLLIHLLRNYYISSSSQEWLAVHNVLAQLLH